MNAAARTRKSSGLTDVSVKQDGRHARVLPDVKDESGVVRHALELSGPGFEPIVLYVNADTALIAKQAYVAGGGERDQRREA